MKLKTADKLSPYEIVSARCDLMRGSLEGNQARQVSDDR
jgi:hypothetical protein